MVLRRTVLVALVTGLAFPAEQALAQDPPPPDIPSVAAYVEMVPTSRGSKKAGAGTSRPRPLPPSVEERLRASGGDDAAMLEQLATSPGYGAPTGNPRKQREAADEASEPADRSNALSAAVSVSADRGEGRLPLVIAVLVAVTLAIGIVAMRRRPRASS